MSPPAVRRYESRDRDAVRRIVCETADIGAPLTAAFPHRAFFADLLTAYYTDHEPASLWVAVDAGDAVVGYLMGCLDTRRYLRVVSRRVTPVAFARALFGGAAFSRSFWRFLWAGVLTGLKSGSYHHRWLASHPAHLHINLLPAARAGGTGRLLMERFLRQATAAGVPGVHLGTRGDNTGARRFFERQGFVVLERPAIVDPFTLETREMIAYGRVLP